MIAHSVSHLADSAVIGKIRELVARGNSITAELLVCLAEAEERKLHLSAGYSSMLAYCVGELHLSEDAACDRLDVARVARQFPAVFTAVAEGRLHLSAVLMLRRYLTPGNADELIRAAMHQSKAQIAMLLAHRFPRPDVPTLIQAIAPPPCSSGQHAPQVEGADSLPAALVSEQGGSFVAQAPNGNLSVPERIPVLSVPERITPRPKVTPLSPQRYATQFTMHERMHDKCAACRPFRAIASPRGTSPKFWNTPSIWPSRSSRSGSSRRPRSRVRRGDPSPAAGTFPRT